MREIQPKEQLKRERKEFKTVYRQIVFTETKLFIFILRSEGLIDLSGRESVPLGSLWNFLLFLRERFCSYVYSFISLYIPLKSNTIPYFSSYFSSSSSFNVVFLNNTLLLDLPDRLLYRNIYWEFNSSQTVRFSKNFNKSHKSRGRKVIGVSKSFKISFFFFRKQVPTKLILSVRLNSLGGRGRLRSFLTITTRNLLLTQVRSLLKGPSNLYL